MVEGYKTAQSEGEGGTQSAVDPQKHSWQQSVLNSSFPSWAPDFHNLRTFQNWAAISQIWSLPEGRRGSWVKSLQTFWNEERMKNCIFLL